jgi:hypothetical protein
MPSTEAALSSQPGPKDDYRSTTDVTWRDVVFYKQFDSRMPLVLLP